MEMIMNQILHSFAVSRYEHMKDDLCQLFEDYPHKDFQLHTQRIEKSQMVAYLYQQLETLQARGRLFSLSLQGRLKGLLCLVPKPWLSRQLGLNIWYVQHLVLAPEIEPWLVSRLLREAVASIKDEVDFVFARPASSDILSVQGLESIGFRNVGCELVGNVRCQPLTKPLTHELQSIQKTQLDDICSIARMCHEHNHYIYDPRLSSEDAAALFEALVRYQATSEHVEVLVATQEQEAVGFLSFRQNKSLSQFFGRPFACLDFIGVHPRAQGQGVGHALNLAALHQLHEQGVKYASVRTMSSNYLALAALHKLGYRITSSNFVLHWWPGISDVHHTRHDV
tara:strand:- start:2762 stop:3778 length:1017 start_codon:yes stop_codon:yes gene_type:complete